MADGHRMTEKGACEDTEGTPEEEKGKEKGNTEEGEHGGAKDGVQRAPRSLSLSSSSSSSSSRENESLDSCSDHMGVGIAPSRQSCSPEDHFPWRECEGGTTRCIPYKGGVKGEWAAIHQLPSEYERNEWRQPGRMVVLLSHSSSTSPSFLGASTGKKGFVFLSSLSLISSVDLLIFLPTLRSSPSHPTDLGGVTSEGNTANGNGRVVGEDDRNEGKGGEKKNSDRDEPSRSPWQAVSPVEEGCQRWSGRSGAKQRGPRLSIASPVVVQEARLARVVPPKEKKWSASPSSSSIGRRDGLEEKHDGEG